MLSTFRIPALLWLGDVAVFLAISLIGYFFHAVGEAFSWRWLATFLPFCAGWLLIAPWMGVYRPENAVRFRPFWRAALAAFLAAPFAAWLRGEWLNAVILPLFVLVLGLNAAFGMGVWRLVYPWIARQVKIYG
jgi:hypothetical protein